MLCCCCYCFYIWSWFIVLDHFIYPKECCLVLFISHISQQQILRMSLFCHHFWNTVFLDIRFLVDSLFFILCMCQLTTFYLPLFLMKCQLLILLGFLVCDHSFFTWCFQDFAFLFKYFTPAAAMYLDMELFALLGDHWAS